MAHPRWRAALHPSALNGRYFWDEDSGLKVDRDLLTLNLDFSEILPPPENPAHSATGTGGQDRADWAVKIPRQGQLHPVPCICQSEDPNVWAIEVGQRESRGPRACHSLVPAALCASPPWFWNRLSSKGDLTKPLARWRFWEILSLRNLLHSG